MWSQRSDPTQRLLTEREVLDLLHVSKSTLRRWLAKGEFPGPLPLPGRLKRWDVQAVDDWLEECAAGNVSMRGAHHEDHAI